MTVRFPVATDCATTLARVQSPRCVPDASVKSTAVPSGNTVGVPAYSPDASVITDSTAPLPIETRTMPLAPTAQ